MPIETNFSFRFGPCSSVTCISVQTVLGECEQNATQPQLETGSPFASGVFSSVYKPASAQSLQFAELTTFHKDGLLIESTDTLSEGRYELTIDGNHGATANHTKFGQASCKYASIFSPRTSFHPWTYETSASQCQPSCAQSRVRNVGGDPTMLRDTT